MNTTAESSLMFVLAQPTNGTSGKIRIEFPEFPNEVDKVSFYRADAPSAAPIFVLEASELHNSPSRTLSSLIASICTFSNLKFDERNAGTLTLELMDGCDLEISTADVTFCEYGEVTLYYHDSEFESLEATKECLGAILGKICSLSEEP